jgi:hypothetical protein
MTGAEGGGCYRERVEWRIGRPNRVENFRKLVPAILEEKAELPSLEILRRVREAGYRGGKTGLYSLVARLRPKGIKPLVRFEGLPGEFSQHDFGQIDVECIDGTVRRIRFFASRLERGPLPRGGTSGRKRKLVLSRLQLPIMKLHLCDHRAVVPFYNKRGTAEQWIKEGKQAVKTTRLSCPRFRSNRVRLALSLLAYNLGNLWRRLALPRRIENSSLTSLQQRLVKTGGRLVKHGRYYWLFLHLNRRRFGTMLGRIALLAAPTG